MMNILKSGRNLAVLLSATTLSITTQAQNKTQLSLQQCVQTALANNLTTRQSDLQSQSADVTLKQAKANRLPNIQMDITHGANQGRNIDPFTNTYLNQGLTFANYGLSGSVTLYNGGSIANNIKQQAYTYEATKMDLQQTKDDITLQVILAYLQVLSNEDQLQQNRNQAGLSKKQVERLEIMNADGAVTPSDLYDLKGQYANDELAIITSQNAVNSAKLTLAQLMNVPLDTAVVLERINIEKDLKIYDATSEMIYESAAKQLGYVRATEYRKLSAQKALKAAKGSMYPTLYLSGGLYTNYSSAASTATLLNTVTVPSGDYIEQNGNKIPVITTQNNYDNNKIGYFNQFKNNYNTSVAVGLRIPILNSLIARTRVRQAKITLENADLVEESTKVQLRQQVDLAHLNMTAAFARYNKLDDQVIAFKESFRIADIRFNAGAITSVDYLVAKNNLDRSNINYIISKYEYILRTKVLDYYQGKNLWQ